MNRKRVKIKRNAIQVASAILCRTMLVTGNILLLIVMFAGFAYYGYDAMVENGLLLNIPTIYAVVFLALIGLPFSIVSVLIALPFRMGVSRFENFLAEHLIPAIFIVLSLAFSTRVGTQYLLPIIETVHKNVF